MTQNIYGLTRNTRPRGVQYIVSGSKQFRINDGPHLKGSRRPRKKVARPLLLRRPKVVFFGAQADFFFFFFSTPSRNGVRRPNNFFAPPPKKFGPPNFFSPPNFFFRRFFFFFGAQNQKSAFSAGAKNRLSRRASKEQRPKSCILGSTTTRTSLWR